MQLERGKNGRSWNCSCTEKYFHMPSDEFVVDMTACHSDETFNLKV